MEEKDYIIVGLGIAGICIAEQLLKHNKSVVVIDNCQEGATAKSGGVFNPTVLKRFTVAWNGPQFFSAAQNFYTALSQKLNLSFFENKPILRIFKNIEELNNWTVASDKIELRKFLSTNFLKNTNSCINAPLGFGEVLGTAQIHSKQLLASYNNYLKEKKMLISENFQYELLQRFQNKVVYKNISAKKVIFTEGAKAIENPFFPKLAIIGNKGEYLIIESKTLKINTFLKGPLYVIPLGNDQYKVGATYSRDDYSIHPTTGARAEIISKLDTCINCPYTVLSQTAGVRPTTRDHRPILGNMEDDPNLVFFNGLGSRGFLMAPLLSEILFDSLENNKPIAKEMDIKRIHNWE